MRCQDLGFCAASKPFGLRNWLGKHDKVEIFITSKVGCWDAKGFLSHCYHVMRIFIAFV